MDAKVSSDPKTAIGGAAMRIVRKGTRFKIDCQIPASWRRE